jgi:hypothetical protein
LSKGEENVLEYNPTPGTFRKWCNKCGTGICQGPKNAPFIATFPSTYDEVRQQFPQGKMNAIFTDVHFHANMENSNLPAIFAAEGNAPAWEHFPPALGGPDRPFKLAK